MKAFLVTPPPHVHATDRVAGLYAYYFLALAPALLLTFAQLTLRGVAVVAACAVGALALDSAASRFAKGFSRPSRLATLYEAALFVTLASPSGGAAGSVAALLFGLLFGKLLMGGLGMALFQPACLAWLAAEGFFGGAGALPSGVAFSAALLAGGAVLLWFRLVDWQEAAAFLGAAGLVFMMARHVSAGELARRADIFLAAFFLVPALGPRPLELWARSAAALLAGALAAALEGGVPVAVLVANICAPSLNRLVERWRVR